MMYRFLLILTIVILSGCSFDLNELESIAADISYTVIAEKDFKQDHISEYSFNTYQNNKINFNDKHNIAIFKVIPTSKLNNQDHVLVIDYKYLNSVQYFSENSNNEFSAIKQQFKLKPTKSRIFSSEKYVFSLNADRSHYLIIDNYFDTALMVKVVAKDSYIDFDKNILAFFMVLYSSFLALFLVNVIYYLFIKNSVYLYYSLYLMFGFMAIYWQESRMIDFNALYFPVFGSATGLFFLLLTTLMAYLFIYKFLNINWKKQLSGKLLILLILYFILLLMAFIFMYAMNPDSVYILSNWYNYTIQLNNIIIVAIAWVNFKDGNRQAGFLLVSWLLLITMGLVRIKFALNPQPNSFWLQHSYEFGLLMQSFTLALGLADQALGFKKSRDVAIDKFSHANRALFAETLIYNFLYQSKQEILQNTKVKNFIKHIEYKFADMVQKYAPISNLTRVKLIAGECQAHSMSAHNVSKVDKNNCSKKFLDENKEYLGQKCKDKQVFSKSYICNNTTTQIIGIPLLLNYKNEAIDDECFLIEVTNGQVLTHSEITDLDEFIKKALKALANSQETQEITKHAQDVIDLAADKDRQMRLKDRFFANVSHEFRTPLTLTIAPLKDLHKQRDFLNTSGKYLVDTALANAQDLLGLVENILDVQKLETETFPLRITKVNINKLIYKVIKKLINWSLDNHQTLVFNKTNKKDYFIYCDRQEIGKVITNLLSNAIKYSGKNSQISISIEIEPDWLKLHIEDNGMGIEKEIQQHVFERYYQAENKNHMTEPGTGIGLSYVKDVMKLHHGKVSLVSELKVGSTFTLWFKHEFSHFSYDEISGTKEKTIIKPPKVIAEDYEQEIEDNLKSKKNIASILIVEDNKDLRKFISFKFRNDFKVVTAKNGREGILKAREFLPDLIISDIMMPEIDGIEMIIELRRIKEIATVPIILLTAKSANIDAIEGLQTGADDYITKPFDFDELRARVDRLIASRKAIRAEKFNLQDLTEKTTGSAFQEKLDKSILENIADTKLNVDKLAHLLFLDRSNLYRKIKNEFKVTPIVYIRKTRMNFAINLLKNKKLSVSETAYACGFDSLSYFSKQFKKTHGFPPSDVL